jgi:ligand-binding SRPBCC domain-containing protein
MASITKKIVINAPVGKVFNYVTRPENWTKYVTSLIDVRDVSSDKIETGTTFKWTYRMLGMNFNGKGHVTEYVKNKKFGLKMEGSFPIQETYAFTPVERGTELSFDIQYEVPGKIMGIVAKRGLIEKLNKKETANVIGKIKMLCEEL